MKKGVFDITRESPCIRTCSIPTKSQQRCVFAWKNPRAGWSRALKNYKGLLSVEIEFRCKLVCPRHFRVETNLFNLYCANAFNWLFFARLPRTCLVTRKCKRSWWPIFDSGSWDNCFFIFFLLLLLFSSYYFFFYNLNAWLL